MMTIHKAKSPTQVQTNNDQTNKQRII